MPTSMFMDWSKESHVCVDASSITLGTILAQPKEGKINHHIPFQAESCRSLNITIL